MKLTCKWVKNLLLRNNWPPPLQKKRIKHPVIFADGGIARLRVYGRAIPDWSKVSKNSVSYRSYTWRHECTHNSLNCTVWDVQNWLIINSLKVQDLSVLTVVFIFLRKCLNLIYIASIRVKQLKVVFLSLRKNFGSYYHLASIKGKHLRVVFLSQWV